MIRAPFPMAIVGDGQIQDEVDALQNRRSAWPRGSTPPPGIRVQQLAQDQMSTSLAVMALEVRRRPLSWPQGSGALGGGPGGHPGGRGGNGGRR